VLEERCNGGGEIGMADLRKAYGRILGGKGSKRENRKSAIC